MILTLKLKQDILDLLEHASKIFASKKGMPLSDSNASKMAFNHGEFVMNLRKWNGEDGGPTTKNVARFETCMREFIGEKEYAKFLKSRTRPTLENAPVDDFDS